MKNNALLIFVVLAVFTGPAHAMDVGECGTPEAMTAKFKAEGQRSIGYADLVTPEKRRLGVFFTVNADLSTGYIVHPGALLKAPDSDALRLCDEFSATGKVRRDICDSHNVRMRKVELDGERTMMQGFVTERQENGAYKTLNEFITITGNVNGTEVDSPL